MSLYEQALQRLQQYHQQYVVNHNNNDTHQTGDITTRQRKYSVEQPPEASIVAVGSDRGSNDNVTRSPRRTRRHSHTQKQQQQANNNISRQQQPQQTIRRQPSFAAVLIGLFDYNNDVYVLLTQRSSTLKSHSGEVCLPGGKRDDCDNNDNTVTALREAYEEIALPTEQCHYITELPYTHSKAGHRVTPIVATVPIPLNNSNINSNNNNNHNENNNNTFVPSLSIDEVEYVFVVPLSIFLSKQYHRSSNMLWRSKPFILHYFDVSTTHYISSQQSNDQQQQIVTPAIHNNTISQTNNNNNNIITQPTEHTFLVWGLTASILIETARIVYGQDPEFDTLDHSNVLKMSRERSLSPPPSPSDSKL